MFNPKSHTNNPFLAFIKDFSDSINEKSLSGKEKSLIGLALSQTGKAFC